MNSLKKSFKISKGVNQNPLIKEQPIQWAK